jgi:hypothetical protein
MIVSLLVDWLVISPVDCMLRFAVRISCIESPNSSAKVAYDVTNEPGGMTMPCHFFGL